PAERLREAVSDVGAVQRRGVLQRKELLGIHRRRSRLTGGGQQVDADDSIRARVRKWVEHHRIEHRKQTSAGGDAERQNDNGGGGESTTAPETARGVEKILRESGEHHASQKHRRFARWGQRLGLVISR